MAKYKICFITVDKKEKAIEIARKLVEEKLAACVNIIENVYSIYRWQRKIEEAGEFLLVIKTKAILEKDIIVAVKAIHPYTVPEIVFFDITEGNEEYLNWLGANTLFTSNITKDKEEKEK